MATIEQRAKEKFPTMESPNWYYENEIYRPLYIEWCKEQLKIDIEEFHPIMEENVLKAIEKQKEIDIEKACKWLAENACNYYYSSSQADNCCYDEEELVMDFRKAMEE